MTSFGRMRLGIAAFIVFVISQWAVVFTGRYPHSNGLVGLAHHGFEYRPGVRTLPQILHQKGWYSALFGMQHETSFPARLGFDEFDVSNSYCDYVVDKADEWLRSSPENLAGQPFLLTAGFFETHRPYPRDRYEPADSADVNLPVYLPDTPEVRGDLADFYGAIASADAAVGRLLDTLDETGLDANTWVVFFTDHGPAFPRAKSTLYDAGTGIALIVRLLGASGKAQSELRRPAGGSRPQSGRDCRRRSGGEPTPRDPARQCIISAGSGGRRPLRVRNRWTGWLGDSRRARASLSRRRARARSCGLAPRAHGHMSRRGLLLPGTRLGVRGPLARHGSHRSDPQAEYLSRARRVLAVVC